MALIHNDVFDAALTEVATATEVELQNASGTAIVDSVVLDGSNYGAIGDNGGAGGGRKRQCLVSSGSDMLAISVTAASGGTITKAALKDGSGAVLIVADVSGSGVVVGGSDQVNIGTFSVILKDPS